MGARMVGAEYSDRKLSTTAIKDEIIILSKRPHVQEEYVLTGFSVSSELTPKAKDKVDFTRLFQPMHQVIKAASLSA